MRNQNSQKIWTYSRSRSSKVINLGDNRKPICNFLLVISSNFGRRPISLKIACSPIPLLFDHRLPRSGRTRQNFCLQNFWLKLILHQMDWATRWWRKFHFNFNRFWLIHPCDGQTDRRAIAYCAQHIRHNSITLKTYCHRLNLIRLSICLKFAVLIHTLSWLLDVLTQRRHIVLHRLRILSCLLVLWAYPWNKDELIDST